MSMSYHNDHENCSSADAVFHRDQSWFQDSYSSHYNDLHSPNFSVVVSDTTCSPRDLLFNSRHVVLSGTQGGTTYSPKNQPVNYQHEPNHSPALSTYSTHSQEVEYTFDPKCGVQQSWPHSQGMMPATCHYEQIDPSGNSTEDDYSQIQFSNRNVQRKCSNSSHYIYQFQSQNQLQVESQIVSKSNPPVPPTGTSCSASSQLFLQGDATQAFKNSVFQSVSSSCSSNCYPYNQSRYKTLSSEKLNIGRQDYRKCSYSNEQVLEVPKTDNRDHSYTDLETGPPKLVPISGMLTQSPDSSIVRPIVTAHTFVTPQKQNCEQTGKYSSHDDGYVSQDYGVTNQNAAYTPDGSYHMVFDRSASDFNVTSDRSDSVAATYFSRFLSNHNGGYIQTLSPNDSGIGELEAILKEKDAELNKLRDVMNKNERAIFQVYEEKRKAWVRNIQDIRDEYETKIWHFQRKSYKSEQIFNLQICKLQQEKKAMQEEIDKLKAEKDDMVQKCESFAEETNKLQALIVDATSRRQLGDVSNLQREIDNLNCKQRFKAEEVLRLTAKLDETKSMLDKVKSNNVNKVKRCSSEQFQPKASSECLLRSNHLGLSNNEQDHHLCHYSEKEVQTDLRIDRSPEMEILKPLMYEKDREINALHEKLDKYHLEMLVNKNTYEKEKEQWLEEKNKVIMYQKQLQLNYVQMFRKNNTLESEIEQLTIELENQDLKLMSLNGEESVC